MICHIQYTPSKIIIRMVDVRWLIHIDLNETSFWFPFVFRYNIRNSHHRIITQLWWFPFSKKVISFNLYLSLDCFIEIYWVGEVLFDRNTRLDGTLGEEDWKGERCFLFWNPLISPIISQYIFQSQDWLGWGKTYSF